MTDPTALFEAWWDSHKRHDLGSKQWVARRAFLAAFTQGQQTGREEERERDARMAEAFHGQKGLHGHDDCSLVCCAIAAAIRAPAPRTP